MYAALLIAFVASASAFPASPLDEGVKTCLSSLQTSLGGDADFKTKLHDLAFEGKFTEVKDEVLNKIKELCPDQYERINAFVQEHSAGLQVLEKMYDSLSDAEKENIKKWHESHEYSSLMKFFFEKYKTLSAEDQQALKDTFMALLKPMLDHKRSTLVNKFLSACTPEEKTEVEGYFKNHEFDKLTTFVKSKIESGSFTDDEKKQINGYLDMLRAKQQQTTA